MRRGNRGKARVRGRAWARGTCKRDERSGTSGFDGLGPHFVVVIMDGFPDGVYAMGLQFFGFFA